MSQKSFSYFGLLMLDEQVCFSSPAHWRDVGWLDVRSNPYKLQTFHLRQITQSLNVDRRGKW